MRISPHCGAVLLGSLSLFLSASSTVAFVPSLPVHVLSAQVRVRVLPIVRVRVRAPVRVSFTPAAELGLRRRRIAHARSSLLPLHNDANPSLDGDGSSFDIDSARKQLQSIFKEDSDSDSSTAGTTSSSNSNGEFDIRTFVTQPVRGMGVATQEPGARTVAGKPVPLEDSLLPPLPPLSTIERDRREAEIMLLEKLAADEDAMKELWNLWYSERGGLALARLQQADQLMGDPTSWKDCETSLLQLIDEFSIYFVEPVNRLATLYYLQGKYQEAYQLCRLVLLKLKPWHVGALAGMVQVCINLGDRDEARYWATKRLPNAVAGSSFPPFDASNGPENPRRAEWVQEMVNAATQMLEQAEQNNKKRFGKPEDYYKKKKGTSSSKEKRLEDEDDAWQ
jgi:hypothetical protein